jgi:hypothetical protein
LICATAYVGDLTSDILIYIKFYATSALIS